MKPIPQNKNIEIRGANLHNLRNIDVDIPRNRLTVITGVSGSGKSSLAFDTLYAEGQRRFVESLSSYARQFLERMGKPDVDQITGLPPAIAIEQNSPTKNPRSTVGTSTEIYDYIRLLFGRIGKTIDYKTGNIVRKDTPQLVVEELLKYDEKDKIYLTFELSDEDNKKKELDNLKKNGYFRILKNNSTEIINIEMEKSFKLKKSDKVDVLIDRFIIKHDEDTKTRMTDSVEAAFIRGNGKIKVWNLTKETIRNFSDKYECAESGIEYIEPEPKLFSFNNPFGACPSCQGFGRTIGIDEDLVIPDRSRSIENGAILAFKGETHSSHLRDLIREAINRDIPIDVPIAELTSEQEEFIWEGGGEYHGINGFFKMLEEQTYKMHYRVLLSKYRAYTKCKACGGSRLRTSARQTFVGGKNIPEIIKMPLAKVLDYINTLELSDYEEQVVGQVVKEIQWRLQLLVDIGLDYLTLNRLNHTLSGGESQRITLSTALGSSLVGTLYVLDEPSIGMHPRDTNRLLKILFKLRNLGNTIVVVEHDPDIIQYADHIIDLGPYAGEHGGELVFAGNFKDLLENKKSLTGKYFSGKRKIHIPKTRRRPKRERIVIHKPIENNLKMDLVEIPKGIMTVVTGVSGSGKSTLVHDILYAGIKKQTGGYLGVAGRYEKIEGYESFEHIEIVDQSSIGKSSRSTPATYTKVFDAIRDLYSNTQLAKQLGYKPGHFSFNVPGGRCDVCEGEGFVKVDMQFLPDVMLECEACKSTRYKKETRNILYNGKSIVDVLNMTIDDAVEFFQDQKKIVNKLSLLQDVGLGYLRMGQPSTMLSGGESQRIKLAGHLSSSDSGETLFIFDEPTTGLHMDDISKLIKCFNTLVEQGHTLVIIEHNVQIMAIADYIIDMGPEAGEGGGHIVCEGTPEAVANHKTSYTAKALKEFFESV